MRRITIFLPDELHERLRQDAFRSRLSMAEVIRLRLERRAPGSQKRRPVADPLLKAAGVCRSPRFSEQIDEEIYGI
jgi:hypothetical protein